MPTLLDLFCGAGGAAMGYCRAGFTVVGVDNRPQKNYPFEFHEDDAGAFLAEHGQEFDAIHASPPCQGYSRMRHLPWLRGREYPLLIGVTRRLLRETGRVWVIENVMDAPLSGIFLCGTMFGMPLLRHRRFESSVALCQLDHQPHRIVLASGHASLAKRYVGHGVTGVAAKEVCRDSIAGHFSGAERAREIMGIDWMSRDELSQAIPPSYTEYVGQQLLRVLV